MLGISARGAAALSACAVVFATALTSAGSASAALTRPRFALPAEGFATMQRQTTCDPAAKPGVRRFANLVLAGYPGTSSSGIARACRIGGRSEHKEGRAWDWNVDARDPVQRAQAHDLLRWLFEGDERGVAAANARRLGLMYVIYDGQIWGSYAPTSGWRRYRGKNNHVDHMHFSFSRAGANGATSFFRAEAVVAPVPGIRLPAARRGNLPRPPFTAHGPRGPLPMGSRPLGPLPQDPVDAAHEDEFQEEQVEQLRRGRDGEHDDGDHDDPEHEDGEPDSHR